MYRGSDWDNRYDTAMYRYSDPFRMDRFDEYRKDKWMRKHRDYDMDERRDRFRRDFDEDKDWKKEDKDWKKDKHHHEWKDDKDKKKDKHQHEKDKDKKKDKHHEWKDDKDKKKDKHHDEWKRDKHDLKKWKAVCDMGETDEYWLVRAELPGVRKDKLCVEMEGKDLIICGKKQKEFWHDKLLKRGVKHNQNCSCGDSCTCHPTCKCGVSTISKDDKGKLVEASIRGDVKDTERKGDLGLGSKDHRKDMKFVSWYKKERGGKGKFKRKIHLPKRVDHTAIEALYKDGVLEVLIKKPIGEMKSTEGHTIPVH